MSYQRVDLGTPPAATDGDTVRTGMDKLNAIIDGVNGSLQMGQRPVFGTATPWDSANFSPSSHASLSGAVFTGDVAAVNLKANAVVADNAAGTNRGFSFYTAGSLRWRLLGNSVAESGSNAGTNFSIDRYSDTGAFIDSVLLISRSTGVVAFTQAPTFPTASADDNSTKGASTAFVQTVAATAADARVNGASATGSYAKGALIRRTVITALGTFAFDPRATAYFVEGCGGGGAGGGSAIASGACSAGAGGGSGAWGSAFITGANFANVTVTIGAGGAPGAGGAAGGNGGQSSFGSVLVLPGGSGGAAGGPTSSAAALAGGGTGGAAPSGTNVAGSNGYTGEDGVALSGSSPRSGKGASGPYGAGGNNVVYNGGTSVSNGGNASGHGAGGGGAAGVNSGIAPQGGAGSAGMFVVWEYA